MVYGSFLIRCWLPVETEVASSSGTFFVEHVQTGEQFRTHSLEEAVGWIRQTARKVNPNSESEE